MDTTPPPGPLPGRPDPRQEAAEWPDIWFKQRRLPTGLGRFSCAKAAWLRKLALEAAEPATEGPWLILAAYWAPEEGRSKPTEAHPGYWFVPCPYCARVHTHGAAVDGGREPHCAPDHAKAEKAGRDAPGYYILRRAGDWSEFVEAWQRHWRMGRYR